MNPDDLTPKQQAFVDSYLTSFNGTQAAADAGYKGSKKQLGVIASQNLTKLSIQKALAKRTEQILRKREIKVVDVYEELRALLTFAQKMKAAAELWLLDPNDETGQTFTMAPRAEEIDIVYWDLTEEKPVQKRDRLDKLLGMLAGERPGVLADPTPFIKTVDLRELSLKIIDRCDNVLDKFSRITGLYQRERANDEQIAGMVRAYAVLRKQFIQDNGSEPTAQQEETLITNVLEYNGRRVDEKEFRKALAVQAIDHSDGFAM